LNRLSLKSKEAIRDIRNLANVGIASTPTIKHTTSLNRFKEIAGADAAEEGVIVCRINKKKSLPDNNVAIPWNDFSEFLDKIVVESYIPHSTY
jgi:hypothetical protein